MLPPVDTIELNCGPEVVQFKERFVKIHSQLLREKSTVILTDLVHSSK